MTGSKKIERALISVSDKSGLNELLKSLSVFGTEIISTGGTAKYIRDAGFAVTDVSDVTGFPEMMDGRVKTLHPKIHGALLALRDNAEHVASMKEHSISPIDLVVVNLYPFEQTVANEDVRLLDAVENIDIGGPAMIRSASKNWRDVAVLTDSRLYGDVISELNENDGALSLKTRARLAALAYTRTAAYDLAISSYLSKQLSHTDLEYLEKFNPLDGLVILEQDTDREGDFPEDLSIELTKLDDLRYGENPHQNAAVYAGEGCGIATAEQISGKEMSYNNYIDADAAWNLVWEFEERAVAIIKHTNPSGVGLGATNIEAYKRALATDTVSAFGGIVALNRECDEETAKAIIEVFTEVVIAPVFSDAALAAFSERKNLRVLKAEKPRTDEMQYRKISGGALLQTADSHILKAEDLQIVTIAKPTDEQLKAMLFAWNVCKHVKSNAIVLAKADQTVGVGAGQMNRVDSVRISAIRAKRFGFRMDGVALASDAFFPFRDNVDEAAAIGVKAIIQPGGSMRDQESIDAANEHGIVMAFTGIRHFRH